MGSPTVARAREDKTVHRGEWGFQGKFSLTQCFVTKVRQKAVVRIQFVVSLFYDPGQFLRPECL